MNKRDLGLLAAVVIIAAGFWLGFRWMQPVEAAVSLVEARRQGALELSVPLSEEGTYLLTGPDGAENELCVAEGKAFMLAANCPDRRCVSQGAIDSGGQSIVCLPHKLVVQLAGAPQDAATPDTIAK